MYLYMYMYMYIFSNRKNNLYNNNFLCKYIIF